MDILGCKCNASSFSAWHDSGEVAQLGEHVLCKHEVVGSRPILSTIYSGELHAVE